MIRSVLRLSYFNLPLALACLCAAFLMRITGSAVAAKQTGQPASIEQLVISEFYYNPPGLDAEREWVELANLGPLPLPAAGIGLGDEEQPGGGEGMLRFPEGGEIGPGDAIVIARTAVGFRALFGVNPDYEITDTDTAVPDMIADKQWASGEFALANDGDEIILIDNQDNIIDALNYGDQATFFTPSIPLVVSGQSIERVPAVCDTDSAVDWRPQAGPTPGVLQIDGPCAPAPVRDEQSEAGLRAVGEIQGSGDISPLLNQVVTFRGLVTGTLEDRNAAGVIYHTMFVQDVPGFEDGDPGTSDAIAVFLGQQRPRFNVGDQIVVSGQVTEYFGLTEIDDNGLSVELESPSQTPPVASQLELPQDKAMASTYLEAHEGMLVSTSGLLPVLGPTHSGCGFALGWTPDAERQLRQSGLGDHVSPILVLNQSDVDCSDLPALKTGDLLAGVAGPLTFHFEQFKVIQQNADMLHLEPAPAVPPQQLPNSDAGKFRVATLNLDNYLVPSPDQEVSTTERLTAAETEIKKRKHAYTISHTLGCPELIGVQEVESEPLLLDLADILSGSCGFTYQVTHRDSADGRGIDVALLSVPRRVRVEAMNLRQTCTTLETGVHDGSIPCPPGEEPLFSRPPLEVALTIDGEPMTIFVNHFKSKRGGELETAPRRQAQARHVHDLLQNHLLDEPQAAVIVLGDFNDYNLSPVWQQLQEGGVLFDAMQEVPLRERYSYIFDGLSQLVDGILVSPALVHRIDNIIIPHVNADFPISLALDDSPSGLPYHASDHDPVLITLRTPSYSNVNEAPAATRIEATSTSQTVVQPTAVVEADVEASPTPLLVEASSTPVPVEASFTPPPVKVSPTPVPVEATPTPQALKESVPQSAKGSNQYGLFAGLAVLLLVTAAFWLGRRGAN